MAALWQSEQAFGGSAAFAFTLALFAGRLGAFGGAAFLAFAGFFGRAFGLGAFALAFTGFLGLGFVHQVACPAGCW